MALLPSPFHFSCRNGSLTHYSPITGYSMTDTGNCGKYFVTENEANQADLPAPFFFFLKKNYSFISFSTSPLKQTSDFIILLRPFQPYSILHPTQFILFIFIFLFFFLIYLSLFFIFYCSFFFFFFTPIFLFSFPVILRSYRTYIHTTTPLLALPFPLSYLVRTIQCQPYPPLPSTKDLLPPLSITILLAIPIHLLHLCRSLPPRPTFLLPRSFPLSLHPHPRRPAPLRRPIQPPPLQLVSLVL